MRQETERWRQRDGDREMETERGRHRERETERWRQRDGDREKKTDIDRGMK